MSVDLRVHILWQHEMNFETFTVRLKGGQEEFIIPEGWDSQFSLEWISFDFLVNDLALFTFPVHRIRPHTWTPILGPWDALPSLEWMWTWDSLLDKPYVLIRFESLDSHLR